MDLYHSTHSDFKAKTMSRNWLLLLLPLLFILSIKAVVSNPPYIVNISGESMLPTVEDGDKAVFKKTFLSNKVGKVHAVSTFKTPYSKTGTLGNLIKRVIAGPGDTLLFNAASGEWLEVNGKKVIIKPPAHHKNRIQAFRNKTVELIAGQVEHLGNPVYRAPAEKIREAGVLYYPYLKDRADKTGLVVVHIPKDHYFVMSDNWLGNMDSRYFGPLHKKYLRSQALAVIPKAKYPL